MWKLKKNLLQLIINCKYVDETLGESCFLFIQQIDLCALHFMCTYLLHKLV